MKYFIIFFILFIATNKLISYDNKTAHKAFNEAIVKAFEERAKNFKEFELYNFSFDIANLKGPAVVLGGWWLTKEDDRSYNARQWIVEGGYSADEPEVPAAYRHFYDPIGLNGANHLTDLNFALALFNPSVDAIYWHINGNDNAGTNNWSWMNGKEYLISAFMSSETENRELLLATAYRCLGEVLHNTADMGCPPHVRNDAHGGMGLGGGDPYESGFKSSWVSQYSNLGCEPNLKSKLENITYTADINKALAEFTNTNFFSDETISGTGVKYYKSRYGKKDYPLPKLENLNYEPESFNYFYQSLSGRDVELANDQSLFLGYMSGNFRSYPRVTLKNVESQAQELIPAIIEAGVNVMRRFFPVFDIAISVDTKKNEITGEVKIRISDEYPKPIYYVGKMKISVNNKLVELDVDCQDGKFTIPQANTHFKKGDKIYAYSYFGHSYIKSNEIVFEEQQKKFAEFEVYFNIPCTSKIVMGDSIIINDNSFLVIGNDGSPLPIKLDDDGWSSDWNYSKNDKNYIGNFKITISNDTTFSFTYNENITGNMYNANFYCETKEVPLKRISHTDQYVSFRSDNSLKYYISIIGNLTTSWKNESFYDFQDVKNNSIYLRLIY